MFLVSDLFWRIICWHLCLYFN